MVLHLQIPENTRFQVDVDARTRAGARIGRRTLAFGSPWTADLSTSLAVLRVKLPAWARSAALALPVWLLWLSLGLYAFTRLYALPAFPIYFFTDEAIQSVSAADLLNNHFFSPTHELLPTYFENGSQFNLSASVYLQVLPYILFGKSIWVTRGAAALMTLIAAGSLGLVLKRVFKNPYPWLGVMVLSTTPAWFLHSRTAFETALAASFFAGFLYYYLMYRSQNPRYLFGAVGLGALAFYSYSGMRAVLLVMALLLFLSDLKYHWQNRKIVLLGLGAALLLALPFARFLINHPDASSWQLRILGSYLTFDIPLVEKLDYFWGEYLHGLDPLYWYLPNPYDLSRHILPGYGHLLRQTMPLGLLGVGLAIRHIRNSAYRTLLIAVLSAPVGAALVQLGITRILVMVIPMAILTALATSAVMEWLHRRWQISRALMSLFVFLIFAGANIYMLWDSLSNGPFWFENYGLTGMQYGAQQVSSEIDRYLKQHPGIHLVLSPAWANGTDVLARYFFPDPLPFDLGGPDSAFQQIQPLENTVYVMIPEEFDRIPRSRFSEIKVEKEVLYPNGRPGFYFVRLKYVDKIQEVIAKEEEQRRKPVTERLVIENQKVDVSHPPLDIGQISDLFGNNPDALVRSAAINPMLMTFDFVNPRPMQGLSLRVGGMPMQITLKVWMTGQKMAISMSRNLPDSTNLRDTTFDFPQAMQVTRLSIEIRNINDTSDGNVHLWKIKFR